MILWQHFVATATSSKPRNIFMITLLRLWNSTSWTWRCVFALYDFDWGVLKPYMA